MLLERKIAEARTKKDMLKARAQAAKAQQQIQNAVGDLGGKAAMAAFERMEDKVDALAKYMPELFDPPPVEQFETLIN